MTLTGVSAEVAIRRMWIYADRNRYDAHDIGYMQLWILNGHMVTYAAADTQGNPIGQTTVAPENFPVTLVTETHA